MASIVRCAWCGKLLKIIEENFINGLNSHGICKNCSDQLIVDLKEHGEVKNETLKEVRNANGESS